MTTRSPSNTKVVRRRMAPDNLGVLKYLGCVLVLALLVNSCRHEPSGTSNGGKAMETLTVTSTAFTNGQPIPPRLTQDGANASPPLTWSQSPAGTKSLALICDDPDAPRGTWVHWVLYNLPADTTGLPEGVPKTQTLPGGARQGANSGGRIGYDGPKPPPGHPHRYFFKVYALDTTLDLTPGITKEALAAAMEGHVLASGELMGSYQR
ncbi:MAG: YbhB/YbcL family Raf kinase inhibitor-like protein [Armatimonadota bacterium]